MIRNEDYEAEEGRRGGDRMHFVEMKNGILRNAIKTEDEKVFIENIIKGGFQFCDDDT